MFIVYIEEIPFGCIKQGLVGVGWVCVVPSVSFTDIGTRRNEARQNNDNDSNNINNHQNNITTTNSNNDGGEVGLSASQLRVRHQLAKVDLVNPINLDLDVI